MIPEIIISTLIYTSLGLLIGGGTVVFIKICYPQFDVFRLEYLPYYRKGIDRVTDAKSSEQLKRTRLIRVRQRHRKIKKKRQKPPIPRPFVADYQRNIYDEIKKATQPPTVSTTDFHEPLKFSAESTAEETAVTLFRGNRSTFTLALCVLPSLLLFVFGAVFINKVLRDHELAEDLVGREELITLLYGRCLDTN